jgi:predicted nuclease of predicted toxin-antitoxin system
VSLRLYMDVHIHHAITLGLRLRSVDVMTAQEDGAEELDDPELLDRASELERVLFSMDQDLLREAAVRQHEGRHFSGIVYADQLGITIGQCVEELELICKVYDPQDISDLVERLPLRR